MTDYSRMSDEELLAAYRSAPAGPKAAPQWGADAVELPDGSIARYGPRGGMTILQGPTRQTDAPPDIKEFQANAAARATLMDQGFRDYQSALAQGYNPNNWRTALARGMEGTGVGNWLADVVRDPVAERARAAELQFVDGALRTTTGANAPEPEVVRANRAYFQQPGESAGVEGSKAELRRRFRDQAARIAGPAYIPIPPAPNTEESGRAIAAEVWRKRLGSTATPNARGQTFEQFWKEWSAKTYDARGMPKKPAAPPRKAAAPAGGPVRVKSPEEAARLAPGTVFITPDGRRKVR